MVLEFNGIKMPTPKQNGFQISYNKIWSRNTGRNDNGDMVGTIIAIKKKVEIEWAVLTTSEIETINSVVNDISNPFTSVKYTDDKGKTTEITAYFGDLAVPIYSFNANGKQIMTGVKLSSVEK